MKFRRSGTLTFIFNLSINQGIFPDSMKLTKVVPIFKQRSRLTCSNYRPISVLPSVSKVFEKCIFNQPMFYFTNENDFLKTVWIQARVYNL